MASLIFFSFLKQRFIIIVIGGISLYQGVRMRKGNLIICTLCKAIQKPLSIEGGREAVGRCERPSPEGKKHIQCKDKEKAE